MTISPLKKINQWLLPGFMLVASGILLVVSVPRFLHELTLVPGTPILERINAGISVTDEELALLEKSRLDALSFVELPNAYTDLGSSYLIRARSATTTEERLKYARMSIQFSTKGLELAPINTFAWLRVATAHILLESANHDEGLEAWRNSIATARFEPFILIQRVHIGIILYHDMAPEDIAMLKGQLKMAYVWDREKLKHYAKHNNLLEWMAFLSDTESEITEYLLRGP